MRVLSARNGPLSSTMPLVSLDHDQSPLSTNRKSVDYGIRGRSIYKPDRPVPEAQQDLDAYTELKYLYERALTENHSLKGETHHENSLSTVRLDKESSLKISFTREIEELHETIAETTQSMNALKDYHKELIANKVQAKKELEEQKNMYSFAKDNMISLLQGKLNNTVDLLKSVYRDKKNLEAMLEKEEKVKHHIQGQCMALEEKIKVLEGRVKEPLSVSGLNSQIATVLNKQEAISKKIEKYEAYIQSKMKKN